MRIPMYHGERRCVFTHGRLYVGHKHFTVMVDTLRSKEDQQGEVLRDILYLLRLKYSIQEGIGGHQ